ncbi:TSC22 domain family protein 1-like isoform X1 [Watersipora subatra]|uniref:TSC22 domain family protein 1-like isoform X1 n=1 Tax=Watersipora subatra TaxID=2589382 RepID=UPI00355B3536
MLSVKRLPTITTSKSSKILYRKDINSDMIGASIVGDSRSGKKRSSGKLLDNDTLLVILNTVLRSPTSSVETESVTQKHNFPRQRAVAAIDYKIEKAMDSVKMELLFTVRKEVKELKSQVASLQIHNRYLEQENRILRSAAAPETLAQLDIRDTTSSTLTSCSST